MSKYIKDPISGEVLLKVRTELESMIIALTPFKVALTDSEKLGARTMATGREGYARAINQIATVHYTSLARELDPMQLESMLLYDGALEGIRQQAMALLEIITETQLANGVDTMKLVDAAAANLQSARKLNASLDNAMGEIDEWNKRFGAGKAETNEPGANPVDPGA